MAENLDDIFKSEPVAQDTADPVEQQEAQPQEAPQDSAPAAHEDDPQGSHVPVSAFVKAREDWKQKATRAEEQAKLYREENERLRKQTESFQQPQQQPQQVDPIVNMQLTFSEQLLRTELKEATDIDETIAKFTEEARRDPSLTAAMFQSPHPWKFAYQKMKQIEAMKEIGDDPTAYRAKVEAEIRAQLQAAQAQPQAPAPLNVPASLNGARSVAPRNAPTFSGPTPLGSIFNR